MRALSILLAIGLSVAVAHAHPHHALDRMIRRASQQAKARSVAPAPTVANDPAPTVANDPAAQLTAALTSALRMREDAIARCIADPGRRVPEASGTIALAIVITAGQVQRAFVASDDVHDFALDACLVAALRTVTMAAGDGELTWPVAVSPLARP